MKSMKSVTAFSAVLVLLALAGGTVFAAEATILKTDGDVQVRVPESKEWKPAETGQSLPAGSEILTASNSSCIVGIGGDEKSVVRVNPDSRAVLHSYDPAHVDLQSGKLFALVRGLKKGSDFRVSTPTAVASARGTGWGQDNGSVDVFEDNVNVDGKAGGEQDVPEGDGVKVNPDGTIGETYELSEEKIEEWNAFKEDAEEALGEGEDEEPGDEMDEIKEDSAESDDQDDIDDALEPEEPKDDDRYEQFFTQGQ